MNKTEAKLVAFLLRWALGDEDGIDPMHSLVSLADRVRAALGEGPDRYEVARLCADRRPKVTVRQPAPPPEPEYVRERWAREKAEALAEFDRWHRFMGSTRVGETFSSREAHVFARVRAAVRAVSQWRAVSNTRVGSHVDEESAVAVRVALDSMASEITAAATDRQDFDTINWVVAGLRCRRQPFCVGCSACQTVTSPHRRLAS